MSDCRPTSEVFYPEGIRCLRRAGRNRWQCKFDVGFEAKPRQVTTVLDLEAEKCYLYLCVAPVWRPVGSKWNVGQTMYSLRCKFWFLRLRLQRELTNEKGVNLSVRLLIVFLRPLFSLWAASLRFACVIFLNLEYSIRLSQCPRHLCSKAITFLGYLNNC